MSIAIQLQRAAIRVDKIKTILNSRDSWHPAYHMRPQWARIGIQRDRRTSDENRSPPDVRQRKTKAFNPDVSLRPSTGRQIFQIRHSPGIKIEETHTCLLDERTDERANKRTRERTDGRTDERHDRQITAEEREYRSNIH